MHQSAQLWQLYQHTHFILHQEVSPDLAFAIVTAHNPRGRLLSNGQNRLLDRKLQGEVGRLQVLARPIIGCSPDLGHREKSWMIFTDRLMSMELARQFQQNAIYWVEAGELWLLPCLMHDQLPVCLGEFAQRLILRP